ncbi:MAG: DUF6493 family protein [Pseudomonadota bacterium]
MTPEQLEDLVLTSKKESDIRSAFMGMPEADRVKLSTTAQKLFSQFNRAKVNAGASEALKRAIKTIDEQGWGTWNLPETKRAALAVYACGPLSAVTKQDFYTDTDLRDAILGDRKPEWLGAWVDHELEKEWSHLKFQTVRAWVKSGACKKPTVDGYYRQFATHMMSTGFYDRHGEKVPPISRQLLAEPDLLDDIEGLFRVETNAFNTNSWFQKGASDEWETWTDALLNLSAEGHYPRDKLLDHAVTGLRADIKQNQLSGYAKFFKAMKPTKEELLARQGAIIDLLCHKVGLVQKFSVDTLAKIETSDAFDTAPALRELPAVFAAPAKGTAISALKLLEKIIKRSAKKGAPDTAALEAVIEALQHENGDVQAKAMAILSDHASALDDALWDRVEDASGFIAASHQRSFAELLAKSGRASDAPEPAPTDTQNYEPLSEDLLANQVLFEEDRIEPIATLDELIDAAFHAVEVVDGPDEIERIIDGISRMADQRPADFDQRVAPMLHRLSEGSLATAQNGLATASIGVGDSARAFVQSWASGELHGPVKGQLKYYSKENSFVPVIGHLHAMAQRVVQGIAKQPLATPTHRGGWIDPLVWVERLRDRADEPGALGSIDLHRSLVRLAPDNRAAALHLIADMPGDLGRVARFALGGEDRPAKDDAKHYASWLCAARSCDPTRDWSETFAVMRVEDTQAGGAKPARFEWRTSHTKESYEDMRWKNANLSYEINGSEDEGPSSTPTKTLLSFGRNLLGKPAEPEWKSIPTIAANGRVERSQFGWSELLSVWISQWLFYIWPQDVTGAYFRATSSLMSRIDEDTSSWSPSHGYFDALFVRGRPWGEGGHLVLCLGLVGKDADAKGLAIDAMIEGIDNGAFQPTRFARIMQKLSDAEWVKLNRLGASLTQVAQTSPLHSNAMSQAMQLWLPSFDFAQRGAFHVLESLSEAQASSGLPLSQGVRANLETLKGSSKAAKLAKTLLSDAK